MSNQVQIITQSVSVSQLQQQLAMPQPEQMFIDVRTPEEFENGHVPGFQNFPLDEIENFMEEFKDKDVVLCCHSGVRSQQVAEKLHDEGHTHSISDFDGGFKAWKKHGLPVAAHDHSAKAMHPKEYHPPLQSEKIHNGDSTLSQVKTNITQAAGQMSHQIFSQAKGTLGNIEGKFVALPPLRQVYAILAFLILMSAVISGVPGIMLSLIIALALIFSSVTGIMFMTDWIQKMPWNKKK